MGKKQLSLSVSLFHELLKASKHPLPLSQESIGMFLLKTCCAFGIERYFVHSQATDNFGGYAVTEAVLVLMTNENILSPSVLL